MRIAVIGGTGLIGGAIVDALADTHDVVAVGNTSGDFQVDISSEASVRKLFDALGETDAVVVAAGSGRFAPIDELSADDYRDAVGSKLMGGIHVVREALGRLPDGGTVTVTTGVLATRPVPGAAALAVANAGLEGFVRAAALEAPRGIRVNAVRPGWVAETLEKMGRDPAAGTPAADVAAAYVRIIEGDGNGEVVEPA